MTVFIDDLILYGSKGYFCHMWSDRDIQELHVLASKIGLKRCWFQNNPDHPHYDLRSSKRLEAITFGAIPISSFEMVRKIQERRKANK